MLDAAAVVILVLVAAEDMRTMKISDKYNIALLALAAVSAGLCAAGGTAAAHEIAWRACGALSVSLPMYLFNRVACCRGRSRAFGGGDIFLCLSAGALVGPSAMLKAAMIAMIAAGVFAAGGLLSGRMKRDSRFPLGPFLCGGIIFMMLAKAADQCALSAL